MFTVYVLAITLISALAVLRTVFKRIRSNSIAHLRGPKPSSWLVGNLPALQRSREAGDAEFAWTKEFGNTMAIKGVMGREILMTGDPKALQYILNTSGYNFPKTKSGRVLLELLTGNGIIWAEGAQHARQRKMMNPAFSFGALRIFLPLFRHTSQRTVARLKAELSKSNGTSSVFDILPWLGRTTLDAIGIAGFDYQFGAIEQGSSNKLVQAYDNLFMDAFMERPDSLIIWEGVMDWVPQWIAALLLNIPTKFLKRVHKYMKVALGVAKDVNDRQKAIHSMGKEGSKDIMSILLRANLAENPKDRLSDGEVLSQLTTLFLAGYETSATALTWAVYELARNREYQTLVRDEIKATRTQATRRGDDELSVADLDSMKYLLSLIKETLRFHSIVPAIERKSKRDDVIPLSTATTTKKGEIVTDISIPAGQKIIISILTYNRLKSVWGDDADVWRPERFIDGSVKQGINMGVLANLASFSSGVRGCIGVIEMQAILIELVENFEFSPPPGDVKILRALAGLVTPVVEGSTDRRSRLPVTITSI
ncbi:cytochrome P450 [Hysterangium stoloniferum]|nr:cytochrome P450 [Hysterangium stoloniferum]